MNETTKAILRREIEQKQRFVDNVDRLKAARHPEAACHESTAARMRTEIADIRSALVEADTRDLMAVDGMALTPALDLAHGEAVHIHNA